MNLQKPSRWPRSGSWARSTTAPEEAPTSPLPTLLPTGLTSHDTQRRPEPADDSSKSSLLVPRPLTQLGPHGNPGKKVCFLQGNKVFRETPRGRAVALQGPSRSLVGREAPRHRGARRWPSGTLRGPSRSLAGREAPAPTRIFGSCSAGCGARCCASGAAASTPGSQGPAPPAALGGPRSSGTA